MPYTHYLLCLRLGFSLLLPPTPLPIVVIPPLCGTSRKVLTNVEVARHWRKSQPTKNTPGRKYNYDSSDVDSSCAVSQGGGARKCYPWPKRRSVGEATRYPSWLRGAVPCRAVVSRLGLSRPPRVACSIGKNC